MRPYVPKYRPTTPSPTELFDKTPSVHRGFKAMLLGRERHEDTREGSWRTMWSKDNKKKWEKRMKDLGLVGSLRNVVTNPQENGFSNGVDKITYTGHSLGGALALLMAYYTAKLFDGNNDPKVQAFTFASPQLGDKKWAKEMAKMVREGRLDITQIEVDGDWVPVLQPWLTHPHEADKDGEVNWRHYDTKGLNGVTNLPDDAAGIKHNEHLHGQRMWTEMIGRMVGSSNLTANLLKKVTNVQNNTPTWRKEKWVRSIGRLNKRSDSLTEKAEEANITPDFDPMYAFDRQDEWCGGKYRNFHLKP